MRTGTFRFLVSAVIGLALAGPASAARLAQTIADANIIVKDLAAAPFSLAATSSAGLPVVWEALTGPASVTGHTVTLTGESGSVTLRGRQAGNSEYDPAPDQYETFIVTGGGGFITIAAGDAHVAAIRADGEMWTWGRNTDGQLGDGGTESRATPLRIPGAEKWLAVACGGAHTVAVRADGTLWAWGSHSDGQLGIGNTGDSGRAYATQVGDQNNWLGVACGAGHTVAWNQRRELYAWGRADKGQLGNGGVAIAYTPSRVGAASDWVEASCGEAHTVGLRAGGSAWAWGENSSGQLGDGTTQNRKDPVRVGGEDDKTTNWAGVSAGRLFSAGRRKDGTLWTWGSNLSGQLGNGTTAAASLPGQVGKDTDWTGIACGDSFVVARKADTWMWAWGDNASGQLGDTTTQDRHTPVRTLRGPWGSVAAGASCVLAVRNDFLWSWGGNDNNQLALRAGLTNQSAVPPAARLPLASSQTIPPLPASAPQTATLVPRSGSFLPARVTVISGPAAVDAGGASFHFTGSGEVVVEVSQPGDAAWSAAPPVRFTVNVTANQRPVAGPDTLGTLQDKPVSAGIAKLLFNDSDPDGDVLTLTGVESAGGHGTVALQGNAVVYTPDPGFSGGDSFRYTVSDPSGATATGMVSVTVDPSGAISRNSDIQHTADGWRLHFAGIPGERYVIEYSSDLQQWLPLLGPVTADERGVIEHVDNPLPAPNRRYYRTVSHPADGN